MVPERGTVDGPRRAPGWPPPGLEPVQGRLWPAVAFLAAGGVVLAVPLLVGAALRHPFWSTGPFGQIWWIPLMASGIGLLLVMVGFDRLFRILWKGAVAMSHGHGWQTVAAAAADTGDTGHLLSGTGPFTETGGRERRWVLTSRLVAAGLALAAGLWLPLALTVTVLLASRAGLGPLAAWLLTLGPPAVLALGALLARTLEWAMARGAERSWRALAPADLELEEEIDAWTRDVEALRHKDPRAPHLAGPPASRGWKTGALVTLVLAPLTAIPVGTLMLASVLGPVLGTTAVPFGLDAQYRAMEVEPFRSLRPAPDPNTDATAAGRLLAAIERPAPDRAGPDTAPEAGDTAAWLPDDSPFQGAGTDDLARTGFARAETGLTPEEMEYLSAAAAHPGHTAFARLGRASALDAAAGHWSLPLSHDVPWIDRTYPSREILQAGRSHLALAVHRFARGRRADAEAAVREVVGVGFLLVDHGVVASDVVLGASLARIGALAYEQLFRAAGRDDDADRIAHLTELGRAVGRRARAAAGIHDVAGILENMPALVLDTAVVRGVRWETFGTLTTIGPCLNAHNAIFGRDEDYREWLDRAEAALVRWPGDAEVFEARRHGDVLAPAGPRHPSILGRVLGLVFGDYRDPTTCAALIAGR